MSRRSWLECRTFQHGGYGILCLVTLLVGCSTPSPAPSAPKQISILYPEGTGVSANGGVNQVASALSQEGLTQFAADARIEVRLAESLKWSDDGLELVVRLKPGVLMHDGNKLDAERTVGIFRTLLADPETIKSYPGLADVKEVHSHLQALSQSQANPRAVPRPGHRADAPTTCAAPGSGTARR